MIVLKLLYVIFSVGDAIVIIAWLMGIPNTEGLIGFFIWTLFCLVFFTPCEIMRRIIHYGIRH